MLLRTLLLLSLCFLLAVPAAFAQVIIEKVQITGLDKRRDGPLIENIEASLSLFDLLGQEQSPSRLDYLLNQAQRQTRQALEPFGYYNPDISVHVPPQSGRVRVQVQVNKGPAARVRRSEIVITGPAARDRYLQQDLRDFRPKEGDLLEHAHYEESKLTISRRLSERGYFDADFTQRRVEIARADNAADIFLSWDSGRRYNMGKIRFHQDYFAENLFDPLVYWEEGSYWHAVKLERLRDSLNRLDYFSVIDMQPDPNNAYEDGWVPVDIYLTPAKRNIYSAGLSYGTASGPGMRAGLERRYVNTKGHKLDMQAEYARKRRSQIVTYKIPEFDWIDGWYAISLSQYEERIRYIDLYNKGLTLSRSGQLNDYWNVIISLHNLRETWRYGSGSQFYGDYQSANVIYPKFNADYRDVDDRLFPRDGFIGNITLRAGIEYGGGDNTNFMQGNVMLRWFMPLFESDRLIFRNEIGSTWTGQLIAMPPSLRYFAGGDLSVRGYAYREIGPRTAAPDRFAMGARNLFTSSLEYEYYFSGGPWGMAVFFDTGSAFDYDIILRSGVGLGLRWQSPLGPVRIDIAKGLDTPDSPFQLYLNIGAER